ncbi:integral membrane protein [Colletotrichum incanum]|nr:integral membrane protein [Colletotrichum incanum]
MPPPGLSIGTGTAPLLALRSVIPDAAAATATARTNITTPPWLVLPRPEDPNEWNGASVVVVAVISAAVATAFVCMRFYTRVRILRCVEWEDWTILASLVFATSTSAGMITQLNFGLGEHLYYAWPSYSSYIEAGTFTNLFYSISLTLTKISILLLYIRILTYDLVRLLGKILLGIVVVSHTWIIVSILTTCIPLSAAWNFDPLGPAVYCHPISVFWGNACLHLVTDFLIFLLPLPVISSMRLPRRQKMGLYFVFCLAFLVCAISIVRLVRLFHTNETMEEVLDVTWSAVRIANLTCLEVHAAIVTACLTTLKPLLVRLFPTFVTSPTGNGSSTSATFAATRDDWEKNFSNGDAEAHYQRPLTIGTKPNRPRVQRDTFASIDAMKLALPVPEHDEAADVLASMRPTADVRDGRDGEFRLAEVDAGAPLRWPSTLVRKSRLQVPQGAKTRSSTLRRDLSYRSVARFGTPVPENRI